MKILFTLLASSVFVCSFAQAEPLTLEEAFSLAENRAEQIKGAFDELESARWAKAKKTSELFPTLSLQSTTLSHQLLARWDILDNAQWAKRKLAEAKTRTASLELALTRQDLRILVLEAYYNARFAKEQVRIVERIAENFRKASKGITASQKHGFGEKALLFLLNGMGKGMEIEERQARFELQQGRRLLEFFIGEGAASTNRLDFPFDVELAVSRLKSLKAAKQPVKVQYLKSVEDQLQVSKEIDMSRHYPAISAIASHGFGTEAPPQSVMNAFASGSRVGLLVNIPLFSGLSSFSEREEWNHRAARAAHETALAERRVNLDFKNRRDRVLFLEGQVRELTPDIESMKSFWTDIKGGFATETVAMQLWLQLGTTIKNLESTKAALTKQTFVEATTLEVLLDSDSSREPGAHHD